MRTLLIGALAATLVGCSCPLPRQASMDACTDTNAFACSDRTAARQPIEPKPAFNTNSATTKIKSAIAKTEKPLSADASDRTVHLDANKTKPIMIAAKVEPPASGQPAATPDPVIIKAKTTIAAKLEDPASAEFGEMNRAIRKNTLGQSVDTICGRVKGKKASGEDAGDRPFLYLVKDDDAYVVDGPAGSAAATAYRNICN
jgi:hypothetical protein